MIYKLIPTFGKFMDLARYQAGVDPGFLEGDQTKREELTLVLYLCSRGLGGAAPQKLWVI